MSVRKGQKIRRTTSYKGHLCPKCKKFMSLENHVCKPWEPPRSQKWLVIRTEREQTRTPHVWHPIPSPGGSSRNKGGKPYPIYKAIPNEFKRMLRCVECGRPFDPPNGECPGSPDGRPYRIRAYYARLAERRRQDRLLGVSDEYFEAEEL